MTGPRLLCVSHFPQPGGVTVEAVAKRMLLKGTQLGIPPLLVKTFSKTALNLNALSSLKRMSADQCLEHEWLRVVPKRGASAVVPLPTDKLKKFVVRRKWLKSGNALKALSRMTNLSGQRPAAAVHGDEEDLLGSEDAPETSSPPLSTTAAGEEAVSKD